MGFFLKGLKKYRALIFLLLIILATAIFLGYHSNFFPYNEIIIVSFDPAKLSIL